MPTLPTAADRLPLLGCALAVVAAMALSSCGEEGSASAGNSGPDATQRVGTTAAGAGPPCPAEVTALVDSLDRLRRRLAVGLSYEQYVAQVKELGSSYDAIPAERLTIDCLRTTGTAAERALNRYIDAANAWGECLADASCTTAKIEPVLQRKWRTASQFLSAAR